MNGSAPGARVVGVDVRRACRVIWDGLVLRREEVDVRGGLGRAMEDEFVV